MTRGRAAMVYHLSEIGPVEFVRSKRARHIKISVRPFKGVRVSYPYYVSKKNALSYVEEKREWLLKNISSIQQFEKEQEAFLKTIPQISRTEAIHIIKHRVDELAYLYGFQYAGLTVRKQRTLWGSCSHRNRLSLNENLVHLPDALMDYVILHELLHTRIKNHSSLFWSELETFMPEARKLNKQLRKYKLNIC